MALKHLNVHQEGIFKSFSKGDYFIDIYKKSTSDMYNIYKKNGDKKGDLLVSVFTKYNSKTTGVKKAGQFTREVFGDYELYLDFINFLDNARQKYCNSVSGKRSVELSKDGRFVDRFENKGDNFYALQCSTEGNILEETFEEYVSNGEIINSLKYDCIETGNKVKFKKIKDLPYRLRDKGENDLIRIPVKTLDMLSIEKDLDWLDKKDYRIVNKEEEFEEFLVELHNYKGLVGFDTETTGLKINRFPINHPQRDNLVGICISIKDDSGIYIPIRHKFFNNLDEYYVVDKLRPYIDINGIFKKDIVTHNGKFDWKVMYTYGIKLNIVHDSLILQYLLNNSVFKTSKKLKVLAKNEIGMDMIELDDIFIKQKGVKVKKDFSYVPLEMAKRYAPADADATRLLVYKKLKELPSKMAFIYWIEIELMKYLAKTEYYGIKLDVPVLIQQRDKALKEKEEIQNRIYSMVGREFNINSNKELPKILYDEFKYPILERTKKGAPSTGKVALELLKNRKDDDGNPLYPLAELISVYKAKEKLLNGFLEKMLVENIDGYIFPNYNQTGTSSGRISCNDPNLQQTPGTNRSVIICDSDDYYYIIADYSQVEYRIMAGFGGELDIIESFKDPDTDHHTNMYAKMFSINPDDVTSKQRKKGKTLNFGITYGMGPVSLAIKLFNDASPEHVAEAQKLMDSYFSAVPNIYKMLQETKDKAYIDGYVETKFHRRRYFPNIKSKDRKVRGDSMRQAANTKVQGTGADILKIAHVKLEREIEKRGLDAQVKISMHDELVTMVHKSINPWYMAKLLRECMEMQIKGFPPLFIGINVGNTWAAGKRDDLEIPIRLSDEMFKQEEHLKAGYDDPELIVEEQIKDYMFNRLKGLIQSKNLNTVEKALDFPAVEKILKDYFGSKDKVQFLEDIFAGKDIDLGNGFVVYNDSELEFVDLEEDTDEDGEETVIDFESVKRLYNRDELEIEGKEVKMASETMISDYRVMVYDMNCYIKINKLSKQGLVEIKKYLEDNNSSSGYNVILDNDGEHYDTNYMLYKVDKIALVKILDKYTLLENIVGS